MKANSGEEFFFLRPVTCTVCITLRRQVLAFQAFVAVARARVRNPALKTVTVIYVVSWLIDIMDDHPHLSWAGY